MRFGLILFELCDQNITFPHFQCDGNHMYLCCGHYRLCCPCGWSNLPGRAAGSTETRCPRSPTPGRSIRYKTRWDEIVLELTKDIFSMACDEPIPTCAPLWLPSSTVIRAEVPFSLTLESLPCQKKQAVLSLPGAPALSSPGFCRFPTDGTKRESSRGIQSELLLPHLDWNGKNTKEFLLSDLVNRT